MIIKDEIRTTLSDIGFYYANIRSFQNALKSDLLLMPDSLTDVLLKR